MEQLKCAEVMTPQSAVLQILRNGETELSLSELLCRLEQNGIKENPAIIKNTIWELVGQHIIEITSRRKVRLAVGLASRAATA